jgi:hypothetical protein
MLNENKSYELTHTELKKFKGFENISDVEATEICLQLKELSLILFDAFQINAHTTQIRTLKRRNYERKN